MMVDGEHLSLVPDGHPAVIFDFDGVIVDSYEAHYASLRCALDVIGVPLEVRDFRALFGRPVLDLLAVLSSRHPHLQRAAERVASDKEARFRRMMHTDVRLMDGAVELVADLRGNGARLAIATSSPYEDLTPVLASLGGRSAFDAIVTCSDVRRGKPDPEIFLLAAKLLKVRPEHAVVIEDAPSGIMAAKSACMKVIGLVSTGHARGDLHEATLVVDSLRELSSGKISALLTT